MQNNKYRGIQGLISPVLCFSVALSLSACKGVSEDHDSPGMQQEPSLYRVNGEGKITENGDLLPIRCGNWTGLEGRDVPDNDVRPMTKVPMELFIGNMWWFDSGRTIEQTMREISALGINVIRLPIAPQTLVQDHPDGMILEWDGVMKVVDGMLRNTAEHYPYPSARDALLGVIDLADKHDLKVIVGIHSCSNYLGRQAGRLDSGPPLDTFFRPDTIFMPEGYSCSSQNGESRRSHPYDEAKWLTDLQEIAEIANTYDNIMGIDIFSEPWDYTWEEWAALAEKGYAAIAETNDSALVLVEGVGFQLKDGTPVAHGDALTQPGWGENLWGIHDRPLNLPRDRLVFSPHVYGPAVYVHPNFMSGDCQNYQGREAAEQGCQIDLDKTILYTGWQEHFGFLREQNYAVLVSEFGGNMDWPHLNTHPREQPWWAHINDTPDAQWQSHFVDYMRAEDINACYWSINPEPGYTDGLYETEYFTDDNYWGQWGDFDGRVVELLNRLWGE